MLYGQIYIFSGIMVNSFWNENFTKLGAAISVIELLISNPNSVKIIFFSNKNRSSITL